MLCGWLEWERPAPLRSLVWASPDDAVQGRLALAGEPALTPDERTLRVAVAERLLATLPERRDPWADAGDAAELDPEPDALTL